MTKSKTLADRLLRRMQSHTSPELEQIADEIAGKLDSEPDKLKGFVFNIEGNGKAFVRYSDGKEHTELDAYCIEKAGTEPTICSVKISTGEEHEP